MDQEIRFRLSTHLWLYNENQMTPTASWPEVTKSDTRGTWLTRKWKTLLSDIYLILLILSIFDCCVTLFDLYRWPIAAVNIGSSMLHATHCCVPPRYRFSMVLSSVIFSERELKFMFAICHRRSVCRLSSVVCHHHHHQRTFVVRLLLSKLRT